MDFNLIFDSKWEREFFPKFFQSFFHFSLLFSSDFICSCHVVGFKYSFSKFVSRYWFLEFLSNDLAKRIHMDVRFYCFLTICYCTTASWIILYDLALELWGSQYLTTCEKMLWLNLMATYYEFHLNIEIKHVLPRHNVALKIVLVQASFG